MKNNHVKLTKKDVNKACWRWIFFSLAPQSFERMQGLSYCYTLAPALDKLYLDDQEEHQRALTRHMQFFNTEVRAGALVPGISLAMEEARANGVDVSEDVITATKNALMGPLAGIGDSLVNGTWNPILLSIGMGLSIADGSPVGPLFFCFSWLISMVGLSYYLFHRGYELGINATDKLVENKSLTDRITKGITALGLVVIGGVASGTVRASLIWSYVSGEMTISLQSGIFDKILPKLFPLAVTLFVWYLMDKKKVGPVKCILGIAVFAGVMVALGIM
jgi:mannose/fructose/N-acetylgalactosamine-specific phosphotransferase system component IID